MAITAENYKKAEAALAKARSNPNEDKGKIERLQMALNSFYEGYQPDEPYKSYQAPGAVPQATQESLPNDPIQLDQSSGPSNDMAGYWYEPSVDSVKEYVKRTGFQPSSTKYLKSVTPSDVLLSKIGLGRSDSNDIEKDTADYREVAQRMYEEDKAKNPELKRYKDIELTKNPLDYTVGGVLKYGPGVVAKAVRGATAGLAEPVARAFLQSGPVGTDPSLYRQRTDEQRHIDEQSADQTLNSVRNIEERSGVPGKLAEVAGAVASPIAPGNLVAHGVANRLGYEGAGVLAKSAISGAGGALSANVEGGITDAVEGRNRGESWEDIARTASENVPLRTLLGGAIGTGFDLAGQLSGGVSRAVRNSDHDLRLATEAGAETHPILGIKAPEDIMENVRAYHQGRTGDVGHPEDIAAAKVAPQIEQKALSDIDAERKLIGEETQAYINHPEIANQEEDAKPLVEELLSSFHKGAVETPLTGQLANPDDSTVNTIRKALSTFGEVKYLPPGEALPFAQQSNGIVLDGQHMRGLGIEAQPGMTPVYVPGKVKAHSLLEFEGLIDKELKAASAKGDVDNPLWKRINLVTKNIRDRFGVPNEGPKDWGNPFETTPSFRPGPQSATALPPQLNVTATPRPEAIPGVGPFQPRTGFMDPPNPFQPHAIAQPPVDIQAQNPVGVNLPRQPEPLGLGPGQRFDIPGQPRGIDAIVPQRPIEVGNQPSRPTIQQPQPQPQVNSMDDAEARLNELYGSNWTEEGQHAADNQGGPYGLGFWGDGTPKHPVIPESSTPPGPIQEMINRHQQERFLASPDPSRMSPSETTDANIAEIAKYSDSFIEMNPKFDPLSPDVRDMGSQAGYDSVSPSMLERPTAPVPADDSFNLAREREQVGSAKTEWGQEKMERPTALHFRPSEQIKYVDELSSMNRDLEEGINRDVRLGENKRLKDWADASESNDLQSLYDRVSGKEQPELSASEAPEILPSESPKTSILPPRQPSSKPDSLFPDVPKQVGEPDKVKLAQADEIANPPPPRVLDVIKKTDELADSLDAEELDTVHSYTQRHGDKVGSEAWKSATKKLTIDNPTAAGALYHGTRMPQAELDKILSSRKLHVDRPLSTSYNRLISSSMAYKEAERGVPVMFKFPKVDNAISLASKKLGLHGTSGEQEILLNDKFFDAVSRGKDEDGNLVIEFVQAKRPPPQHSATLEDGTKVSGLSALRRNQSLRQQKLEETSKRVGADRGTTAQKVLGFGSGPGRAETDAALLEQARALGLEKELREAAGTAAYQRLRQRSIGQAGKGYTRSIVDVLGMRADPFLRAAAGGPVNPAIPNPTSPSGRIYQYLFENPTTSPLNLTRGLPAARFEPTVENYINQQDKDRQK